MKYSVESWNNSEICRKDLYSKTVLKTFICKPKHDPVNISQKYSDALMSSSRLFIQLVTAAIKTVIFAVWLIRYSRLFYLHS